MITNNKGQTVAAFVEIDGVARASWSYEDCRTNYDPINGGTAFAKGQWCDSTGNLFDPTLVPNYSTSCTSPTDPTCWGRIHVEFDGDWLAAGYCGTSTTYCNNDTLVKQTTQGSTTTLIDVQGYVFWDPAHVTALDHSFSGWELHPLAAWRPHQSTLSRPDSVFQITPTGCPNDTNCASGGYPTESSFFLPFTQQKLFQNPRPTSHQDYYVFYRQNMSIPGSGCSGGVGPDFCDECVYAYSPNGVAWRVNQTIGTGPAGVGNFFYNCSATYFANAANNQLVIYVVVTRNSATVNLGHDVEFVIGTVSDTADTVNWGTVQIVSSSSSKQNFQFPVLQVDPNGYLQIAYSWVDTSTNRQTVDLCSSRTTYPITNPSWSCNGGSNNSLFDARTQLGQTDASFMPQLQPIPGHSVLVLQGPCSNTATANCDGPSSLTENATLVNWDGSSQTFTRTATFTYSSLSASDRRSSIADRATGTFYIAYENGTDGKFWTRYLAKPYTSWTNPVRITSDDGEGRISLLSGTRSAKTIVFVEAVDKPLSVSGGGGSGTCGTCPQIDLYTNTTSNGASWSPVTTLYSNMTWAAAWDSIPWYVNTTTTSTLPIMWEQHDCGIGTNIACTTQPEELWFDPHTVFTPVVTPPIPSFAIMTTFDGRIYKYFQNGTQIFISRPVNSALRQVAWKPDGAYALIVGDQGVVYRYNGTTLTRFSSTVIGNTNLNTVAWKPDGSYALIGGQNGFLFQYNGTAATKITDPTNRNLFSISWNPNGNSALIVGEGGTVLMYSPPSKITVLSTGIGQQLFAVSWSPSGAYALAAGENGIVLRFNGTGFKTLNTAGLVQSGHHIRFIGFNPPGSPGLLVGDSGLVWTYDGTKLSSIVNGNNDNLFSLSWLGNKAYIVGQNGILLIYSSGTLTKPSIATNVNFSSIAWQPKPLSVKIAFSPTSPTVQTLVSCVASPNGGVAPYSFNWGFGDGTSALGNIVAHQYSAPGTYNVTVTVTDNVTSTSRTSTLVTVQPSSPPTVAISTTTPNPASTGAIVNLNFAVSSSTNVTGVVVNWGDGSSADNLAGTATKDTHVYTSTGTLQSQVFNITVTASNSGGSGSTTTTETVNDRPPTATISPVAPNPAQIGQTVNASFSATDPDGTVASITVNWGDGSSIDTRPGTATSDTHAYASTGTFTITIIATDNSGSKGQATTQESIQAQIAPPTVTVSSPTPNPAKTGTNVSLNFTISSSAPVTGIMISWGDGTVDNLSGTATSDTHIYTSTGTAQSKVFTINVTATNSVGTGFGTTTETATDRPPSVTISSVTSPTNTGQMVNVTFTASDSDGTLSSISVNWGDGAPADILSGTATSDSHIYNSTGNATSKIFTITISATDNSGSASQAAAPVTINDRPPTVAVSGPSPNPALVGQTVTANFSTNDPDGTVSSITVNWGDGSQPDSLSGTATSDTHTYGSGGTFTITVTATDNSGSQGSGMTSESVTAPLAPTVTINSVLPNPANTGQTVTVTFSVSSTIPVTGITVNWGDGSIDNLAGSATSDAHIYTSTGNLQTQIFTILVTATNTAGSSSSSTSTTINDRAPTVTVTSVSPNPVATGSALTATFAATDIDGTISSITVNWGDGSVVDNLAGTVTSDTHSYASPGNFTIIVSVTDNSGSKAQTTATVSVKPVTTSTPYALSVTSDGKVYKTYTNGTMVLIGQPVLTQLRSVSWRPDGSYALISGDSAVLLKYDGTQLTSVSTGISTGFNFWSVSWKPDGSYALIAGTQGLLFKYDGTTVTMINDPNTLTIFAVSWNPAGTAALLVGKTGTVLTFDGTAVHSLSSGTTFDLDAIGWNPNGSYALIGGLNGTVLRYDGTQVTALLTSGGLAGTNEIKSIAFNPQGTLALLVGDNGMVLTYNGSTFTKLAQITFSWLYSVTWGPNGTAYILGNSGNVLTYSNGSLAKVSSGNTSSYRASAWKP